MTIQYVPAEEFFSPIIEQGSLDYSTMPAGDDKNIIDQFFLDTFGYIPTGPVDFVKIDGKYVYKTNREKRIPVTLASGVKVVNLENIPFKI